MAIRTSPQIGALQAWVAELLEISPRDLEREPPTNEGVIFNTPNQGEQIHVGRRDIIVFQGETPVKTFQSLGTSTEVYKAFMAGYNLEPESPRSSELNIYYEEGLKRRESIKGFFS